MAMTNIRTIIAQADISIWYQPVINLYTGETLGYEALCRGPAATPWFQPGPLFAAAQEAGLVPDLTRLIWRRILAGPPLPPGQRLFVNITTDELAQPEALLAQLEATRPDLINQLVLELPSRENACFAYNLLRRQLLTLRRRGLDLALDNVLSGASITCDIAQLRPSFIKTHLSLAHRLADNPFQGILLEAIQKAAAIAHAVLIVKGLEQEREVCATMRQGINYGQGFFLGTPAPSPLLPHTTVVASLARLKDYCRPLSPAADGKTLGDITESLPTVPPTTTVADIDHLFHTTGALGIVVLQDNFPVGLVMREKLYYHLSRLYGLPLYQRRSIDLIMDKNPLILDADMPIEKAAAIATARKQDTLYDYIIVIRRQEYAGVVSVMSLLNSMTRLQVDTARNANPLTGLPGNPVIEQRLKELVASNQPFAVLYIDLDHFKEYNDRYGFHQGDQALLFTARLCRRVLETVRPQGLQFFGHIGGDDFIIIVHPTYAEPLCQELIRSFDAQVPLLYTPEDRACGSIEVVNRQGQRCRVPIMSMSIAVLTNTYRTFASHLEISAVAAELKHYAKSRPGSVYVFDRRRQ